jgi:predicted RND superfamily exporter protein
VGLIFFLYLIIVLLISILWLIVGLKEFKFISKWNERFKKYFTLKEKLDRELQKEFE